MAKKSKPSVDKVVKKVNKEFERTSTQIEGLIDDALKQFDHLHDQLQEPVRKLLKDMDSLREREMRRFHDEFDRRMGEFQELQSSLLNRLGLEPEQTDEADKQAPPAPAEDVQAKPAAPKKASGGKKKASKPAKAKAKATPKAKAKPADKSDLTRIKGIGPVTAKKMQDAGITSIEQIAKPSQGDKEKLKAFKSVKGYNQFQAEAKKLL